MKRVFVVLAVLATSFLGTATSTVQAGWGKYGLYSRPYTVYPDGWGRKNYLLHYDYKYGKPIPGAQVYFHPWGY